jgi:hypothetical protein
VLEALADRFEAVDCKREFAWLSTVDGVQVAQAPYDTEPFLCPYLPFVGPRYQPGGVMIYATAQNLADTETNKAKWWRHIVGDDSLWRLYDDRDPREEDSTNPCRHGPAELRRVHRRRIAMAPIGQGITLALAGLLHYKRTGEAIADLDDVAAQISCTNFFKFSLVQGRRDFNPLQLPAQALTRYMALTAEHFVRPEVEAIRPSLIISFNGLFSPRFMSELSAPPQVMPVNDPGWIKRGGGGSLSPGGSWRRAVESSSVPERVRQLTEDYLDQCDKPYRGALDAPTSKRAAARTYLLSYYLRASAR